MSSPPKSETKTLRDRLKLKSRFRRLSQDKATGLTVSDASSRPRIQPTISQTQILPGRTAKMSQFRPSLGAIQHEPRSGVKPHNGKQRSSSLEFPERLKGGDDMGEDVAAVHDSNIMNGSLVNMISKAAVKTDLHSRLEDISSESEIEDDAEEEKEVHKLDESQDQDSTSGTMSLPTLPKKLDQLSTRRLKHNLFKDVQRKQLDSKRQEASKTSGDDDAMSSSQILSPPSTSNVNVNDDLDNDDHSTSEPKASHDAPYLSMILKGEADMQAQRSNEPEQSEEPIAEADELESSKFLEGSSEDISLATRLMEIFDLGGPEEVIAEYPAWFLQTVLLSGYLYVTARHICFYAYLPKNTNTASKSGYLGKRGQRNPRYKRYYIELKGDVLRYYTDPNNKYLPSGQIDLRSALSATVVREKNKTKEESQYIKIVTTRQEYSFKADNSQSARDWVKHLQRIIFRSHNDGDSVKLLLPIDNVLDIESISCMGVTETIKLNVIDDDDTYAMDEYFFSFFTDAQEASELIINLVQQNAFHVDKKGDKQCSDQSDTPQYLGSNERLRKRGKLPRNIPVQEPVRPALSYSVAHSRPSSADICRRKSSRSLSRGRTDKDSQRVSPVRMMSEDSHMSDWNDQAIDASAAGVESMDDSNVSPSQILDNSDVFKAPTSHMMPRSRSSSKDSSPRLRPRPSVETVSRLNMKQGVKMPRESKNTSLTPSIPASPLDSMMRAGSYPLGRASDIANLIKHQSRRLSSQVTNQSKDYLERVSGMWQGSTTHYGSVEGMPAGDTHPAIGSEEIEQHSQRFREHFALPDTEILIATYFGSFWKILPLYGKIYVSQHNFCFRSMLPGTRTKLVLPLKDIENVAKKKATYRAGYPGAIITIRGHEEIFFDFSNRETRDDCVVRLTLILQDAQKTSHSSVDIKEGANEFRLLESARSKSGLPHAGMIHKSIVKSNLNNTKFDDIRASVLNFKPASSMNITILTVGTRGDVQPFIALAKGLLKDGHQVKIASHGEFEKSVRDHGIDFATVAGDPSVLMDLCVRHGMFTIGFMRESSKHLRGWINDLLMTSLKACEGSDLLIEAPSAMGGIHIAEALKIPYFRAFTMPWTRTRAYPHAFGVPNSKLGGGYNYMTYSIIETLFWQGIASDVNRWRRKTLGLPSTSLEKLQSNKVPFLYCFSPSVVPPPLDFPDWVKISGYWFLDEGKGFKPPVELAAFIQKAKNDGKKLVYIGFGSIIIQDSIKFTKTIYEAIEKADVRCILAKGWSDRRPHSVSTTNPNELEVSPPSSVFSIQKIPHDWLFPQCDAICFHGGSGTAGEAMRAGVPLVIKAFFGDQYFFAGRAEDLGVGISVNKVNSVNLGRALWEATRSELIKARAKLLGEQIRKENGVQTAITAIYRDLEYARTLIKHDRSNDVPEDIEEHWTFIDEKAAVQEEEALIEAALGIT